MRRELIILEEMLESAIQAHGLVHGVTLQDLAGDRMRRDALLWNLTVLGEATNRLPVEFTERFPDVPWPQPVRLRNRLVHGYWTIDLEIVHTTADAQLPGFIQAIQVVIASLEPD